MLPSTGHRIKLWSLLLGGGAMHGPTYGMSEMHFARIIMFLQHLFIVAVNTVILCV